MKKLSVFILVLVLLQGCGTLDVYEKTKTFPAHEWKGSEKITCEFAIEDTVSAYHIYTVIRHEDAYRFNNIWLNVTTVAPGDTARTQLVNVTLANNEKGWLGTGMDDVFDHRVRITQQPVHLKKGTYTFTLQHAMREEPLQYVLAAGIRVEKVKL